MQQSGSGQAGGEGSSTVIDVRNEEELGCWAIRFGVDPAILLHAVSEVGPLVQDVERKLHGKARRLGS